MEAAGLQQGTSLKPALLPLGDNLCPVSCVFCKHSSQLEPILEAPSWLTMQTASSRQLLAVQSSSSLGREHSKQQTSRRPLPTPQVAPGSTKTVTVCRQSYHSTRARALSFCQKGSNEASKRERVALGSRAGGISGSSVARSHQCPGVSHQLSTPTGPSRIHLPAGARRQQTGDSFSLQTQPAPAVCAVP